MRGDPKPRPEAKPLRLARLATMNVELVHRGAEPQFPLAVALHYDDVALDHALRLTDKRLRHLKKGEK